MHGDPHLPSEKSREPGDKEGTKARANSNSGRDHSCTVGRARMHPGTGTDLRDSDAPPESCHRDRRSQGGDRTAGAGIHQSHGRGDSTHPGAGVRHTDEGSRGPGDAPTDAGHPADNSSRGEVQPIRDADPAAGAGGDPASRDSDKHHPTTWRPRKTSVHRRQVKGTSPPHQGRYRPGSRN